MPKNKLTPEQREQIVSLSAQGMTPTEIGKQLDINPLRVSGVVSHAVRTGSLPSASSGQRAAARPPSPPPPPREPSPFPPAVSAPPLEVPMNPAPAPVPAASAPPADEHVWKAASGSADGFIHPTQVVEYKIERLEPKDGILEVSPAALDDAEIGNKYGSGTYRIWRRDGTRLPVFRDLVLAPTYGEPRYPHRRREFGGLRPGAYSGRPASAPVDDQEAPMRGGFPYRPAPGMPNMEARPYQDRAIEVARQGMNAQESIAVTAVSKMAEMNEKQLDRMQQERDRDRQPQSVLTDFLKEQQLAADKRAEEERKRRDEDRKREQEEWKRRQDELDAQHRREMDRIKAENDARIAAEKEARTGLMELEKQRLELMREESRIRENALKGELERIRTEAKEERATLLAQLEKNETRTEEQMADLQASVKEQLEKERDILKREHELKEQALANDRRHGEELLRLREEILKGQQGEDVSKVLAKLVEGVERTAKEVLELKKIEAVSAEQHLVKAAQGGSPAPGGPANLTQPPSGPAKLGDAPAATQPSKPNGQHGAAQAPVDASASGAAQETTPEMVVRQLAREPIFINMISKWAKQIQAGNDAGIFSNMFMELMRDDGTAEALRLRKACSYFVDEMSTKTWAEMYDFLKPAIPQNLYGIFEQPHAEVFYEQFKMMVVESVRDYWKMYFAQKQAEIELTKQQGSAAPSAPAEAPEQPQQAGPLIPVAPAMRVAPEGEPKPEVTVGAA